MTQAEIEQHKAEFFARGGKVDVIENTPCPQAKATWRPAKATDKDSAMAAHLNHLGVGA